MILLVGLNRTGSYCCYSGINLHRFTVKVMSKSQCREKKCESSRSSVAATLPEETQDESLRGWMERKSISLEERVATKDCITNLLKIIQ